MWLFALARLAARFDLLVEVSQIQEGRCTPSIFRPHTPRYLDAYLPALGLHGVSLESTCDRFFVQLLWDWKLWVFYLSALGWGMPYSGGGLRPDPGCVQYDRG